jgi:hypothetical protein
MDKKPVDSWPPYDSPQRVTYADRWPLPEAAYNEARKRFTPESIKKIRAALEPPRGFPLVDRLRLAVYDYHHLSADLLAHLGTKKKKAALAKIRGPVEGLLALLEDKPQYFAELYGGSFDVGGDLAAVLADLRNRIDQAEPTSKPGPPHAHPRNVFFAHLLAIYEDAAGAEARSANTWATRQGRAFEFFKAAHNLLIEKISDESINRFLKPLARRRSRVFSALPLLRK